MKIKLDENLPYDLGEFLRLHGHDVDDVVSEGLGGEADPIVQAASTGEERILFTFDLDFADVRDYPVGTHAGIVVFRVADQRWQTLKASVENLLRDDILGRISGGLAIVDETRIRVRLPPKS